MGYAVPGSVLALGLMLFGGPLAISPLMALIWGLRVRFLADVQSRDWDAGLERAPPKQSTNRPPAWAAPVRRASGASICLCEGRCWWGSLRSR